MDDLVVSMKVERSFWRCIEYDVTLARKVFRTAYRHSHKTSSKYLWWLEVNFIRWNDEGRFDAWDV